MVVRCTYDKTKVVQRYFLYNLILASWDKFSHIGVGRNMCDLGCDDEVVNFFLSIYNIYGLS